MNRPWNAENDAERARLYELVASWSDEQLATPMPAGWTVSGVLAHLAFWDARATCLIEKWEGGTPPSEADREWDEVDIINDAAKPLCLALPPRIAADLALRVATETDARVASMSDELIQQMQTVGEIFYLARASHRKEHLDEIAAVLRSRAR